MAAVIECIRAPVVALFAAGALLVALGCESGGQTRSESPAVGGVSHGSFAALPAEPHSTASSEFWEHWGDGRAELSAYRGEIRRYGELREATATLIYVTEPHDRRTWVKDDSVGDEHRVNVLKLNRTLKFQTGIYPYSVMTSVFSPVADWGRPRFQPTKITMTSQEWCGNVFAGLWPGPESFYLEVRSYFDAPGDERRKASTPPETLYQDALPIQLRELDGAFNGGEDWRGHIVPSHWHRRKQHEPLEPVEATIERSRAKVDGTPVTRFVLEYGDVRVTYEVEREFPRRLIRWRHSDDGHLRLLKTERLPYWKLNARGDERYRKKLGLEPTIREPSTGPGPGAGDDSGPAPPDGGGPGEPGDSPDAGR